MEIAFYGIVIGACLLWLYGLSRMDRANMRQKSNHPDYHRDVKELRD